MKTLVDYSISPPSFSLENTRLVKRTHFLKV
uniref:Uncharacterized protein n=1 Tax=Anguilla anguilla TaxID=7936 RepID=A0A0E9VLX6_ANGAN